MKKELMLKTCRWNATSVTPIIKSVCSVYVHIPARRTCHTLTILEFPHLGQEVRIYFDAYMYLTKNKTIQGHSIRRCLD